MSTLSHPLPALPALLAPTHHHGVRIPEQTEDMTGHAGNGQDRPPGRRPDDYPSHPSEPLAKRQKVRLACRECRDRKTRCDGGRPICDSCSRKKLPEDRCVYAAPDVELDSSYVTSLEARVQELESILVQPRASTCGSNVTSSGPAHHWPPIQSGTFNIPPDGVQSLIRAGAFLESTSPSPGVRSQAPLPSHINSTALSSNNLPSSACQDNVSANLARHVLESPRIVEPQNDDQIQNDSIREMDRDSGQEDSPAFLGSSSAVGFMTEVYQTLKPSDEQRGSNEPRMLASIDGASQAPSSWFGNFETEGPSTRLVSPDFVIPPRQTADSVLNNYWLGAHPLQPFLYPPSFMKRYNQLWTSSPQSTADSPYDKFDTTSLSNQIFHCQLNLAFTLGCRFQSVFTQRKDPDLYKMQQTFFNRATKLLTLELMDNGSIELVQALLLMAQYLQTMNLSNRCWVVVGMAIRVAQGCALHLDICGESQAQREERRRTWYFCILLDRVQSMTFGRPLMLQSLQLGPLPQMVDDEYLATDPTAPDGSQPQTIPPKSAYFVSVVKLSNITADILRLVYAPHTKPSNDDLLAMDYNSLLRLDSALLSWQADLPAHIRYNRSAGISSPNNMFLRQSHLLHHRFLNSRILLFRRLLVQVAAHSFANDQHTVSNTLQQSVAMGCVEICTSAAQELLDDIQPNIGSWLVPPAWFTVFLIYTAGTVLSVVFLAPSLMNSASHQKQSLLKSWKQCIDCLKEYQQLGAPSASRCLRNLQKMHVSDGDHGGDNDRNLRSNVSSDIPDSISSRPETSGTNPALLRPESYQQNYGQASTWGNDSTLYDFPIPDPLWPNENIDWLFDLAGLNQTNLDGF